MIEWNEQQEMIRDAIRKFVEAEIKPKLEDLEHGDLPPGYGNEEVIEAAAEQMRSLTYSHMAQSLQCRAS